MMGDPTLFQRADMVEAGWSVVQPILDVWTALPPREFPNYPAGSWDLRLPLNYCVAMDASGAIPFIGAARCMGRVRRARLHEGRDR